jgi:peroxiredoxin
VVIQDKLERTIEARRCARTARSGANWHARAATRNLVLAIVTSLSLALSGCLDETPKLDAGEPAPGFELPRLTGDALSYPSDLAGHIVAIRFWADWCPFCENDMAGMEAVFRTYRENGLRVLAVNVGQDRETAQRFVDRLGITYDVLLDRDGSVTRRYGVIGLPATFFVDRQGRLATRILGESKPEVVEQIVRDLL